MPLRWLNYSELLSFQYVSVRYVRKLWRLWVKDNYDLNEQIEVT